VKPLNRAQGCIGKKPVVICNETEEEVLVEKDTAIVMSFYQNDDPPGSMRINLKWNGKHDISDFRLDRFGEFIGCENETDNTGWVLVRARGNLNVGDTVPLL
jgi:hypothetical protein